MSQTENWIKEIEEEFGSLEEYVLHCIQLKEDPPLFGVNPFNYLYKKDFLKKGNIIRTRLEKGLFDGHYRITSDGKLEGV